MKRHLDHTSAWHTARLLVINVTGERQNALNSGGHGFLDLQRRHARVGEITHHHRGFKVGQDIRWNLGDL